MRERERERACFTQSEAENDITFLSCDIVMHVLNSCTERSTI